MHTVKTNERRGLSKVLGLAVAGATLLAGLVALPVTQASAFDAADDFVEGALDTSKTPQLTVTKYLSGSNGTAATGSILDRPTAGVGTPAKDIVFNVREVVPESGKTVADINPTDASTFTDAPSGFYAAGITNGQGVIDSWFTADASGAPTSTPVTFASGQHYYVMTENTNPVVSPGFNAAKYTESAPSFFGLPYRTTDNSTPGAPAKSGYIYHLHVFPKNVSKGGLTKTVTGVKRGQNLVSIAQAGDVISYRVEHKIYNESTPAYKDQKLDIAEVKGQFEDLRIADRMGTSLKMDATKIHASITAPNAQSPVDLDEGTDYKVAFGTDKPARLGNNGTFFANEQDGKAAYTTFSFFGNKTRLQQAVANLHDAQGNLPTEMTVVITYDATVTADGDSTGDGGVANKVESDFIDDGNGKGPDTPPSDGTITPSGSVAFGKLQKDGSPTQLKALEGAVFRLADPAHPTSYLATDGAFHPTTDTGVTFFSATSSPAGLVAFTGLPILDSNKKGIAANWTVVEVTAPNGFITAPNPFSQVTFDQNVVGKTEQEIVDYYGSNPIEPDYNQLSFATFTPDSAASIANPAEFNGKIVAKMMMNYTKDDKDAPIGLPLTGGRGIILLLVVGVAIMGGALYLRNRRNAARTA
ncbi:SpaH/EbpB family LPXTG-anchored major pilin [Bifidobacterium coryneforme]|uniref:Putative fimbrial subunit FimA n=1 Tax=Bifidobacterium [indicum] DSM 20214 = LMG 11587 TaxID=1341694 RepID=A0A087VT61_9BIFI|nr:SpaH/EbpB family LPXTG-anchored major pilin [Bifidobacterium indicum]AIC91528.1 putative fimbrial subunit FimA [Bifidobacterium indicum LMG 11587 = DSM 20214]